MATTAAIQAHATGLRVHVRRVGGRLRLAAHDVDGEFAIVVEHTDDGRVRVVVDDLIDGYRERRFDGTVDTLCEVRPCAERRCTGCAAGPLEEHLLGCDLLAALPEVA